MSQPVTTPARIPVEIMINPHEVRDRSGQKFVLRTFRFEDGLRDRVLSACGSQNVYGLEMGRVLFDHSCAIWGPVTPVDREINQFVLDRWLRGLPCSGRWVVSRHEIAGLIVEITSNLTTGETRIRRPTYAPTRHRDGSDE